MDLNMIKLLKPDVEISNLILTSCISGFRFLQITVFKRLAFSFSIYMRRVFCLSSQCTRYLSQPYLESDHLLSLTCKGEDKMCQTDRQTKRKVSLKLHKYHHFAMIGSADGDQRLTATAFSAFICKAQSQSLFLSSSSCRCRFWVKV